MLGTASRLIVLLTLFILPLWFIPAAWATIAHAKMVLVAVLITLSLVLWVVDRFLKGSFALPRSSIAATAVLLPVVYGISALLSSAGSEAFVGVGVERDTVFAMIMWVASLLTAMLVFDSRTLIKKTLAVVVASTGLAIVLHIAQLIFGIGVVSLGGLISWPSASLVGSWHDFGILLGFTALLSAALLIGKTYALRQRVFIGTVFTLSLLMLIVLNVQDVWIALAVFSALMLGLFLLRQRAALLKQATPHQEGEQEHMGVPSQADIEAPKPSNGVSRLAAIPLVVLVLLGSVFAVFGTTVHSALPDSIRIVEIDVRPSWEGTFAVGSAVYQERNFLLGSGPNTFTRQWGLYKPAGVNETAFWNTAFAQGIGFIPTSIVTAGLLGALTWALFLVLLAFRSIRAVFSRSIPTQWRWILAGLSFGVVYLWIFHVVYPPGVALLALTFILTGVLIAASRVAGLLPVMTFSIRGSFMGMLALIVLVAASGVVAASSYFGLRAIYADILVNQAVVAFNTEGDFTTAQEKIRRAVLLNPTHNRAHLAAVELGLVRLGQLVAEGVESEAEQQQLQVLLRDTIEDALAAVQVKSDDYQSWLTLARVYQELAGVQIDNAFENAQVAYERAILENPTSPEPHLRLAQLALTREDIDTARTHLEAALVRKNNYALAHFLLSQIEVTEGNTEAAIERAEAAATTASQEPLAWFQLGTLLYGEGDFERAAGALEQAVILNNNYANALFVLGLSYIELGLFDPARTVLGRVAELNPDNQAVISLIASLDEIDTGVESSGESE